MSMTLGHRVVNVDKYELLEKLKENLEIHKKDYLEAVEGYKIKLLEDLTAAKAAVEGLQAAELKGLQAVTFNFPVSHEADYVEVIDMLEVSTDEEIELDSTSFRAYFKNEWNWSRGFEMTANLYKTFNSRSVGAAPSVSR